MKEWFQHDHNARNDLKLQLLVGQFGYEGLGVYWTIIEIMHEHSDRIATALLTHSVMLGARMHSQFDPVTRGQDHYISMIDYMVELDLLQRTNESDDHGIGYLYCERVEANLAKYKDLQDKARKAAHKRHQMSADAMRTHSDRTATAMQIEENRIQENRYKREGTNARFKPPTLDECKAYAKTIRMRTSEVERLHDHYTSNGWKVGRASMKDWKAAMRKWNRTSPPMLDDVLQHFQAHPAYFGQTDIAAIEAQRFCQHYEKQGWKAGNGQSITNYRDKADEWIAQNQAKA